MATARVVAIICALVALMNVAVAIDFVLIALELAAVIRVALIAMLDVLPNAVLNALVVKDNV